jgi:hypothetical protein
LTYSLAEGAPEGATIDPATGVFTWTPGEETGGKTYKVTVEVKDDGEPALTATETFQVTVVEVNQAPVLTVLADQTVDEGTALSLTVTATDADLPAQTLTYSLAEGAPEGATIDPTTGVFTWTPVVGIWAGDYFITIRVQDDGDPALDDEITFTVTVVTTSEEPVLQLPVYVAGEGLRLRWATVSGVTYAVEATKDLGGEWTVLGEVTATGAEAEFIDPDGIDHAARFYRVRRLP